MCSFENTPNGGSYECSTYTQTCVLKEFQTIDSTWLIRCRWDVGEKVLVYPTKQTNQIVDNQKENPKYFGNYDGKNDGRNQLRCRWRKRENLKSNQYKENKDGASIAPVTPFEDVFCFGTPVWGNCLDSLPNIGVDG